MTSTIFLQKILDTTHQDYTSIKYWKQYYTRTIYL